MFQVAKYFKNFEPYSGHSLVTILINTTTCFCQSFSVVVNFSLCNNYGPLRPCLTPRPQCSYTSSIIVQSCKTIRIPSGSFRCTHNVRQWHLSHKKISFSFEKKCLKARIKRLAITRYQWRHLLMEPYSVQCFYSGFNSNTDVDSNNLNSWLIKHA